MCCAKCSRSETPIFHKAAGQKKSFADGNGRISRLMMNFVLHKKGYPMLNIAYEGRNSYYGA